MRTILSTIALFSLCGLCAQEYTPTYGRELPRGEILAYPSAEAATAADGGDNRYFTRLTEWNLKDNVFSTPFTVPFAWANRQVLFHLGWASGDYEVRVNGLPVACNADGNNPAEINITKQAKEGRNMLEVILAQPSSVAPLESWKEAPAPAIGGAWLMSQPTLRVRDVVTRTRMGEDGNATAEIAVAVKSEALNPRTSRIHYQLLTPTGENAAAGQKDVTLDMRREDTLRFLARIPANLLWSAELPTQYTLRLKTQHEGRYVEYLELRLGFRSVEMQDGRMSLNARPVTLRVREVPAAITENEIAGYELFKKYDCATCHVGEILGGKSYELIGVQHDYFADRQAEMTEEDNGRFKQTQIERDRHRFKVPGLRNIELTAPYFHDGSMATMDDAVRAMAKYQLGIDLPQQEVDKIVAFLRTLTGEYKGQLLTNKNMEI